MPTLVLSGLERLLSCPLPPATRGPGSTAALALILWVGTPLLARAVTASRREVEALAASNATLELHSALFVETIRSCPLRQAEAEAAARKASLARSFTLFPSPELATPERLPERVLECCERSRFQLHTRTAKPSNRVPERRRVGRALEIDVTVSGEGSFEQVVHFLSLLERDEPLVRVVSFTCTAGRVPSDGGGPRLTLAVNVATYRLDD